MVCVSVFHCVWFTLKINNIDLIKWYTEWYTAGHRRTWVSKSFQMFRGPYVLRQCKI